AKIDAQSAQLIIDWAQLLLGLAIARRDDRSFAHQVTDECDVAFAKSHHRNMLTGPVHGRFTPMDQSSSPVSTSQGTATLEKVCPSPATLTGEARPRRSETDPARWDGSNLSGRPKSPQAGLRSARQPCGCPGSPSRC